jgi:hypothetical protein
MGFIMIHDETIFSIHINPLFVSLRMTTNHHASFTSLKSRKINQYNMNSFIAKAVLLLWKGSKSSVVDERFTKFIAFTLKGSSNIMTLPVVYTALYYVYQISRISTLQRAKLSEYRVFLTSLILADISLNDCSYKIISWSRLSGISSAEIIAMKKEFLEILDYDLNLCYEDYHQWVNALNKMVFARLKENKIENLQDTKAHKELATLVGLYGH